MEKVCDLMTEIDEFLKEKVKIIDETIEKYVPRKFEKTSTVFRLSKPRYAYNLEALNEGIAKPIWDLLDRGGKRWRPSLFLLICEALGKDPSKFLDYAIILEVVHNGTLMIDDIEDSSEFRRGKPCTYKVFGRDIAINAGNAMYYLPFLSLIKNKDKISELKRNKIYDIYIEEMVNLSFGQATDIVWHRGLAGADKISERQYLQMCAHKTGTLARMAAKLAAVLSDADEDSVDRLGRFAEAIGVAFQIQDDILDLTSKEFIEKKGGRGMDITEGKRTLMVIHALQKADAEDRKRLLEILGMHTSDQRLRDEAITIMEKYNSIEYAKQYARTIVQESWGKIGDLLPPSIAKEKMKAFAQYLVERKI